MREVVRMPRTAMPYTITENDVNLTKTDCTANVESEHWNWRCPRRTALTVPRGARIYMYIATSTPTQITAGTVRIYKASADKITKRDMILQASPDELDAGGTPEDREKQYTIKKGIVIGADEYLLCTINAASAADDAQLKLRIDAIQVLEYSA